MCGIAGIVVKPNYTIPNMRQRLEDMQSSMVHRGPDDSGLFLDVKSRIGLVNRRLAIRDLSPTGHMPMCNPAQTVWITYNGEIYNAEELRNELECLGYCFTSTSDTEVILHGYESWGSAVVDRLRGMFAFAICDFRNDPSGHTESRLLIARDHMGIKPLYYAETESAFIFASEIKALLASGLVSRKISSTGLVGYLLTGSVPNPYTIHESISALQPACFIDISLPLTKTPRPTPYWQLPTDTEIDVGSYSEVIERTRELLFDAVRIRLVSDVPVGAFLSGGLDSSAVVALMRQATSGIVRTCSIVFEEAEYSEARFSRAVADMIGTDHYERVITSTDLIDELDHILYAMDQPSVDGINTYFVSKTAREAGLTVALSGLGGDELFGGYPNTFRDVPRVLQALKAVQDIPGGVGLVQLGIQLLMDQRWSRIADALNRPATLASAYWTRRGLFSPREVRELLSSDFLETVDPAFDLVQHVAERADRMASKDTDPFAWVSRAELRTYTHDQLLRDTDVMSMSHSLEVRVPMLDKRLVEFVLCLPRAMKISNGGRPKPLLSQSVEGLLPDFVMRRHNKQGFTFPFDKWLHGDLRNNLELLLDQAIAHEWLHNPTTARMQRDFNSGQLHWSRIWAVAVLSQFGT